MVMQVSSREGLKSQRIVERVNRLMTLVWLPMNLPGCLRVEEVLEMMETDKKNKRNQLNLIFLRSISDPIVSSFKFKARNIRMKWF
jgi:3-dehydroquinate synthetase